MSFSSWFYSSCPPGTVLAVLQGHETYVQTARHLCAKSQNGVRTPLGTSPTVGLLTTFVCFAVPKGWVTLLSKRNPSWGKGDCWDQIFECQKFSDSDRPPAACSRVCKPQNYCREDAVQKVPIFFSLAIRKSFTQIQIDTGTMCLCK